MYRKNRFFFVCILINWYYQTERVPCTWHIIKRKICSTRKDILKLSWEMRIPLPGSVKTRPCAPGVGWAVAWVIAGLPPCEGPKGMPAFRPWLSLLGLRDMSVCLEWDRCRCACSLSSHCATDVKQLGRGAFAFPFLKFPRFCGITGKSYREHSLSRTKEKLERHFWFTEVLRNFLTIDENERICW